MLDNGVMRSNRWSKVINGTCGIIESEGEGISSATGERAVSKVGETVEIKRRVVEV